MPASLSPEPSPPSHLSQGFSSAAGGAAGGLPLVGLTVLVVEDSRFASEALRLNCLRAGARLRRAETLASAEAHLRLYRPDAAIVDLGLPDGRGDRLIRSLALSPRRPSVILGSSGLPEGRRLCLAAGADGFLEKPLESLDCLWKELATLTTAAPTAEALHCPVHPDPLALRDDLSHAAELLKHAGDEPLCRYVARFLQGIARHAGDAALESAAGAVLGPADPPAYAALAAAVHQRLNAAAPFQ